MLTVRSGVTKGVGGTVSGVTDGLGEGVGKLGKGDVAGGLSSTVGGVGKGKSSSRCSGPQTDIIQESGTSHRESGVA